MFCDVARSVVYSRVCDLRAAMAMSMHVGSGVSNSLLDLCRELSIYYGGGPPAAAALGWKAVGDAMVRFLESKDCAAMLGCDLADLGQPLGDALPCPPAAPDCSPQGWFAFEWEFALACRPASEPLGQWLSDAMFALLKLPTGQACSILSAYQGKVRAEPGKALQWWIHEEVARATRAKRRRCSVSGGPHISVDAVVPEVRTGAREQPVVGAPWASVWSSRVGAPGQRVWRLRFQQRFGAG